MTDFSNNEKSQVPSPNLELLAPFRIDLSGYIRSIIFGGTPKSAKDSVRL